MTPFSDFSFFFFSHVTQTRFAHSAHLLELTTVGNDHWLLDGAIRGPKRLDRLDNIHALQHLPKDHMAAIEPRSGDSGDEKLRPVGVRPRIRHGQKPSPLVLDLEVLIGKLGTVDGLPTHAVPVGEVPTLEHEGGDDTVELGALVVEGAAGDLGDALLAGAEGTEVLHGLGDGL